VQGVAGRNGNGAGSGTGSAGAPAALQPLPLSLVSQHSSMLQQLAGAAPGELAFQELMDNHQRQQQRRRLRLQQQQQQPLKQQQQLPPVVHAPPPPPQQHQSPPAAAAAAEAEQQQQHQQHQQQRQLLQQHLELRALVRQQAQRARQLRLLCRREPAVLTALIKRASSWQRLSQLWASFTPLFNPIHVSAALTHLAQLQQQDAMTPAQLAAAPAGLCDLVTELTAAAAACVPDFGPRQLANSMWAISRLGAGGLVPRRLQGAFLEAFSASGQAAAPQHVANTAAAVARMGWGTSSEWRTQLLQVR
jgi:hypothetical protein